MSKDLVQITEEEFIEILESNITSLQKQQQELYNIYRMYLRDKEKNYIQCYQQDNLVSYTIQKKNPIGFKQGE